MGGMSVFALPYTAASLRFDVPSHTYALPDGRVVPSVTQILKATGISTDFDEIAGISSRLAAKIDERRALGTAVHADAHAFDDDDLDWSTVDPRVKPFVEAWAICRENLRLQPTARERKVLHMGWFFCGTLDGIFLREGKRILVDLKIGDPEDAGCRYQTAGYELGWMVEHPDEPIDERWGVQLCPDLQIPYRVTNYSAEPQAWEHAQKFQAFCVTFHHQAARRRRAA